MEKELPKQGIEYQYFEDLGGRRRALPKDETKNGAWRNKSFQGYADYMQTEPFQNALIGLMKTTEEKIVAIMCAEAVPWRCHRSLIGDALLVRGYTVFDIFDKKNVKQEKMTTFAETREEKLIYSSENQDG